MPIRYQIVGNTLKPGTFTARVVTNRRVSLDTMIANITAQTSLSPSDVRGAVTALIEEVRKALAAGDSATIDGLATFSLSLSGAFPSFDTAISRDTAHLNLNVQADGRLHSGVAASATYERIARDVKAPLIASFYDLASASFDCYTPGSVVRLQGDYLKFDQAKADEGVFIRTEVGEMRLSVYSTIGIRQLDALIPASVSGPVAVVVRARLSPTGVLREGHAARMVSQQ